MYLDIAREQLDEISSALTAAGHNDLADQLYDAGVHIDHPEAPRFRLAAIKKAKCLDDLVQLHIDPDAVVHVISHGHGAMVNVWMHLPRYEGPIIE